MTYLDIRDSLQGLTKEERAELMLDLRLLEHFDDPEFMEEVTRSMEEARIGKAISPADLRRKLAGRSAAA